MQTFLILRSLERGELCRFELAYPIEDLLRAATGAREARAGELLEAALETIGNDGDEHRIATPSKPLPSTSTVIACCRLAQEELVKDTPHANWYAARHLEDAARELVALRRIINRLPQTV